MDRHSGPALANLSLQDKTRESVAESEKLLKDLELKYILLQQENFRKVYGESPTKVMNRYAQRLEKCCYQGGEGYKYWLQDLWRAPTYSHCVVKPSEYATAQPTQMELDAYYVIFGQEMEVTEKLTLELWGN